MTDYDRAAEILKSALERMHNEGIPKTEVPPLLADFAVITAYALDNRRVRGIRALIYRMTNQADEWAERPPIAKNGKPRRTRAR